MAEIATVDVLPPGEKLTLDEVMQRHPNEWVALTDTEVVDMQLLAGVVYAHHPDRDTMRNLARSLPNGGAFLWTGTSRRGLWRK